MTQQQQHSFPGGASGKESACQCMRYKRRGPWTAAHQAPLSMEFSRQEYWTGLPIPSPGDFPNSGIEPTSLVSHALTGRFFTTSATWEAWHAVVHGVSESQQT